MEEIINKPDNQFKDILNDLIDYNKESEEKNALIKEVCQARRPNKPAASLNSSIYSSAASSSSSTSSASASSTNSASSSSTSSTLSSPSQSNQANDANASRGSNVSHDLDNVEVPKMEVLGKKARILEHRLAVSNEHESAINGTSQIGALSLHSDTRSTSLNSTSPWKTISGKRDKRRKKPTEQPVLSQHIPGHKGEQEVDWLVKFIESGVDGANTTNNKPSKKIPKNTKQQSKRQPGQTTMKHDREISQRKSMNKSTITQARPSQQQQPQQQPQQHQQLQQHHPHHQLQQPGQQQPQPKQIANHDNKRKEAKQEEAAVTFAEHIRISDDDVKGRYVFGFFDEQRQQQSGNQAKPNKTTIKHNENSPFNNSNQAGQKHKLKYPKASLNSEQNRYKFNDNIDANSFNYHQILEFISNSWENTAKSHRPIVKHTVSQRAE